MTMPDVGMFTVSWIYDYGLLEELARNAFCVGRYQECMEACQRLLHERGITRDMRGAVVKIADYAAGAIAGFYIKPNSQLSRDTDPEGDRRNSKVLENALRLEDDAFLRARYTFYVALSLKNEGEGEKRSPSAKRRSGSTVSLRATTPTPSWPSWHRPSTI